MRLFLDCEWNDFKGELISMALVPEDPAIEPFYEVVEFYNAPSTWVQANVLPVLEKNEITRTEFKVKLGRYLRNIRGEVTIIADWPEDFAYFCRILVDSPLENIGPTKMTLVIEGGLFNAKSKTPHNALADATANRDYYAEHLI
jgi:hypothetical protein